MEQGRQQNTSSLLLRFAPRPVLVPAEMPCTATQICTISEKSCVKLQESRCLLGFEGCVLLHVVPEYIPK